MQLCEWISHFNPEPSSKIVACTGRDREQSEIVFHASLNNGVHHSVTTARRDDPASRGGRIINGKEGVFIRVRSVRDKWSQYLGGG